MFIVLHSKSRHFFSTFSFGIARFGKQTTRTDQAPKYSFLSLAIPTLVNACARPVHHVLHVTKRQLVPKSGSTQEQCVTGQNKLWSRFISRIGWKVWKD